jgi:serine/threonine protein kinase
MNILDLKVDYTARLGRGGEGTVYRGIANWVHSVAVKFYDRTPFLAEAQANATREVHRIQKVRGSQHIQLLGYNLEHNPPFLVFELAPHGSLAAEIDAMRKRGQVMTQLRALHRIRSVLAALSWVHASGLIHRDIKPGNFLCFGNDQIKLSDFGIGRTLLRPDELQTQAMVGTFEYAAPEQLRGFEVDARADLYAVGVMLYEMLVGERPNRRTGSPLPADRNRGVSLAVNAFVARLLAHDRAHRPASALDAYKEVEALIRAHTPPTPFDLLIHRLRALSGVVA